MGWGNTVRNLALVLIKSYCYNVFPVYDFERNNYQNFDSSVEAKPCIIILIIVGTIIHRRRKRGGGGGGGGPGGGQPPPPQ